MILMISFAMKLQLPQKQAMALLSKLVRGDHNLKKHALCKNLFIHNEVQVAELSAISGRFSHHPLNDMERRVFKRSEQGQLVHQSSRRIHVESNSEILFGRSVCQIVMKLSRRPIFKVIVNKNWEHHEPDDWRVKSTLDAAQQRSIPICYKSSAFLSSLSGKHPHQGICVQAGQLPAVPLSDHDLQAFVEQSSATSLWVLLYDVYDPMNLGAILRTCHFLGVERVFLTPQCAPLSAVTCKASSGASEIANINAVRSPMHLLQELKAESWGVLGTDDGDSKTSDCYHFVDVCEARLRRPSILILGSEGGGIPASIKQQCDELIVVRGTRNDDDVVPCMNVSAASAVVIHALVQHLDKP